MEYNCNCFVSLLKYYIKKKVTVIVMHCVHLLDAYDVWTIIMQIRVASIISCSFGFLKMESNL